MACRRITYRSWRPRPLRRGVIGAARVVARLPRQLKEGTMRPTTADNNVFDFNALRHPEPVFDHPKDVVRHTGLTVAEKRAILASWASDASAIASCPSMRSPAGLKGPVSIDEILEALCELDGGPHSSRRKALSVAINRRRDRRLKLGPGCQEKPIMIDENLARLRAHRNNVHRYRRLLATQLSDLERAYIERRLSEERAAIEAPSPKRRFPSACLQHDAQRTPAERAAMFELDAFVIG